MCILLATLFVYLPGLSGPFLLDDSINLPQTRISTLSLDSLLDVATTNRSGPMGRPIPAVTFALNHHFGDGGPFSFKATNLAIHLLNAALIAILISRLLVVSSPPPSARTYVATSTLTLLATAIWALHPLQVSTVLYVVQRMAMLSTTFTLLALIAYLGVRASPPGTLKVLRIGMVILCTVLACLCKENGVLIALYILLIELVVFGFPGLSGRRLGWAAVIGCGLAAAAALALVSPAFGETLFGGYDTRDFSLSDRLLTQPFALLLYLRMMVAPDLSILTFYHDTFPVVRVLGPSAWAAIAAIGTLAAIGVASTRRAPVVALGIGIFFVSHVLESTILPLELVFEHRNYFALLGVTLAISWIIAAASRRLAEAASPALVAVVSLGAVLSLSGQTHARATEWSDTLTLHRAAFERDARSHRARGNLAKALLAAGDVDGATALLRADLPPDENEFARALTLLLFERAAGIENADSLERVVRLSADGTVNQSAMNMLVSMADLVTSELPVALSPMEVAQFLDRASRNPRHRLTDPTRATLLARASDMLIRTDQADAAHVAMQRAVALHHDDPELMIRLAKRQAAIGHFGSALRTLDRIDRIDRIDRFRSERFALAIEKLRSDIARADTRMVVGDP